ncbi:DegT/DnrJ/EryC1/StrS family aminotransferase, partial [Candidatus Bipolaricaulota bacterium]|nr:DegT/DnrJ/EryC1/StrS family aminotransferase [Candidatus Bipolaricaulota bacterium]
KARAEIADRYDEALSEVDGILTPERASGRSHIFHQYTLRVAHGKRDGLKAHLQEQGIGSMIYYPVPLHLQECFSHLGYKEGQLPKSESASHEVLSLPIFPELTDEEQKAVIQAIKAFMEK